MSNKRASLELAWATIAGIAGWVGSVEGIFTWIALTIFVSMAALLAYATIRGVLARGEND